jgi:amino acid transporter
MPNDHTLSLPTAILININIMLGAGIFINTVELSKRAGSLGGVAYLIVGILLIPLVTSIAQLVNLHPSGGFYIFAQKELSPLAGFISAWSYFIAKLASATLMIHTSISLIRFIIPSLAYGSPLLWDAGVVFIFSLLNMHNIKTSSYIQAVFITLKSIPIIFAILISSYLLYGADTLPDITMFWSGIPLSLPLVLYAATGFETSCSLSGKIRNASFNAPYAIFISYAVVICIEFLYQTLFYHGVGPLLAQAHNYLSAFPLLLQALIPLNSFLVTKLSIAFHLAIASSALGGAYGILFSNMWNLHALAQHKHLFFSHIFTRFNKHMIPFACVLAEGLICTIYLLATGGTIVSLQQVAALGSTLAYTLSVFSLYKAKKQRPEISIHIMVPMLGLASCALLIIACLNSLINTGFIALLAFLTLLGMGSFMFFSKKKLAHT